MTRRRWIADTWSAGTASLTGDQARHLARVLRAEPGAECDIVAGGFVWRAMVASVGEEEVRFNLVAEIESDQPLPVTMLISLFKFDRLEWAVEKLTELGVERIVPVVARRTEKHLALAAGKRVERWRRIARQAAQQCRRSDVPVVSDALPLKNAVEDLGAGDSKPVLKIVLSEVEQSTTLKSALQEGSADDREGTRILMALGPEGGWAPEELVLLEAIGWKAVTLGPRVLRVETAAISALAVIAALLA